MKLQRLATERLLEQRLMDKTFWQKWETTIMTIIVFLVVAISMAIIFFQWSKLLDKMIPLVDMLTRSLAMAERTCQVTYNATSGAYQGLIPATV
jgi:regulatory protein YycI of two-component signal transduction system YycFG